MTPQGQVLPISDADRTNIAASINSMASRGLRTLSIAYRDLPDNYLWEDDERAPDTSSLVLVTVVGIKVYNAFPVLSPLERRADVNFFCVFVCVGSCACDCARCCAPLQGRRYHGAYGDGRQPRHGHVHCQGVQDPQHRSRRYGGRLRHGGACPRNVLDSPAPNAYLLVVCVCVGL